MTAGITWAPRGLRRREAAHYLGLSPSTFDNLRRDGTIPGAKTIGTITIWDRNDLDRLFDGAMMSPRNEWDEDMDDAQPEAETCHRLH